jgi:putative transposase
MVLGPGQYPWSSYRTHAFGLPDKLLAVHEQYERLGGSDEARQQAYRDLFSTELDARELVEIRDAANRGWPLGSDRFKDEIEQALRRAVRPPRRGRPPKRKAPPTIVEQQRASYRIEKLH